MQESKSWSESEFERGPSKVGPLTPHWQGQPLRAIAWLDWIEQITRQFQSNCFGIVLAEPTTNDELTRANICEARAHVDSGIDPWVDFDLLAAVYVEALLVHRVYEARHAVVAVRQIASP